LEKLIKLEHTTFSAVTAADHNVAETYVMFWIWHTTADIDEESDADIREAAKHVSCYCRGNSRIVLIIKPVGNPYLPKT
jgi:aerobic-type carbon monoxide dehydrogenase small subunit (CoxS/CutS family)